MINYLSHWFPNELIVSVTGFKSSAIQFDVRLVNYPTESKIEDKAGYTLARGYLSLCSLSDPIRTSSPASPSLPKMVTSGFRLQDGDSHNAKLEA